MSWKLVHPYLCQDLFECQSTQSISSVLTGGRYRIGLSRMRSSLNWFVVGYSIARSSATCLWNVKFRRDHDIEMLAKGLKYTLDKKERQKWINLAEGQNSTPSNDEGGRIVSMWIDYPSDIMHTLSPYTQHLTQLTFRGKLRNDVELLFNGISIHHPMLEEIVVRCDLTPDRLLSLVGSLAKLGKLAKLELTLNNNFFKDAKSFSMLDCLQSCTLLKEVDLTIQSLQTWEIPSALISSLETLLVGKLKIIITLVSIAFNRSAAEALSRPLQSQYCSLVTLRLFDCQLLNDASEQLAIGIGRNTSLRRVVLCFSQLGSADFKILADALRDNKTLEVLDISQDNTAMMIDKAAIQACTETVYIQNIAFHFKLY